MLCEPCRGPQPAACWAVDATVPFHGETRPRGWASVQEETSPCQPLPVLLGRGDFHSLAWGEIDPLLCGELPGGERSPAHGTLQWVLTAEREGSVCRVFQAAFGTPHDPHLLGLTLSVGCTQWLASSEQNDGGDGSLPRAGSQTAASTLCAFTLAGWPARGRPVATCELPVEAHVAGNRE